MLCLASLLPFLSCSKDDVSSPSIVSSRDAALLVGEWQCTWSKAMDDYNLQENAYVGAKWNLGTPSAHNEQYLGSFSVALDGRYPEDAFGEYHFYSSQYPLPRLLLWISHDNGFRCFNGFHEQKPGDAYRMEADFSIVLTDSTMSLCQFNESLANPSDADVILKFKKI